MDRAAGYEIIWEFTIAEVDRAAFEAAYGSSGEWAALFRKAEGFLETQLLRDDERPNVYVTIDRWISPDHFTRFKVEFAVAYRDLDRRLEGVAGIERRIGAYRRVAT